MSALEVEIPWWKLAIEMIVDVKKSNFEHVTAQNVAGEVYARYYFLGTPPFEELLEACDSYLERCDAPFIGPGYVPIELNDLSSNGVDLLRIVNAQRDLLQAHIAKLNTYARDTLQEELLGVFL